MDSAEASFNGGPMKSGKEQRGVYPDVDSMWLRHYTGSTC